MARKTRREGIPSVVTIRDVKAFRVHRVMLLKALRSTIPELATSTLADLATDSRCTICRLCVRRIRQVCSR